MPRAWWEDIFDERYLEFYDGLLPLREATADAAFIDRALALRPGSHVLDLGCGFGRHTVPLARRGHHVTGLDLSAVMLEHARTLAASAGVEVEWLQRDMRNLTGLGPFDACVCLYTVLGYFTDEEHERIVRDVHALLRPRGRFLLDLTNPLALLPHWPGTSRRETSAGVSTEASVYDAMTARLTTRRVLRTPDGKRRELPTTVVRMYAPHETKRMLESAGFEIEQVYGAVRDKPFTPNRSAQQVWVARR
jgi:2-polyprenyl-3-methyl-5-hydroxy-6-metoxy-1,4-benzoquinol methylase